MGARSKGSCGILAGRNVIKVDSFCCGGVERPQKNGEPAAKSITVRRKIPRKARSISQQFCGESAAGFRKRSQPLLNQLANSILPVLVPPPKGGVSRASAVLLMPHQGLPRNEPGLSPEGEAPELRYEDRTALSALSSGLVGFQEGAGSSYYSNRQNAVKCDSAEAYEGQQQQQSRVIHQSVDHFLAQPGLSLDDMIPPPPAGAASHSVARSGIDNRFSLYPHQGKYSTTASSNNLPDVIRSRGSSHSHSSSSSSGINGGSGARKVAKAKTTARASHWKGNRPDKDHSHRAESPSPTSPHISATKNSNVRKQRSNNSGSRSNSSCSRSSNTIESTPMITRRSQSGGVPQPPPTSLVSSSARATRSDPGTVAMLSRADNSNNISKVGGIDTTLVKEAFAFAERMAKEETDEKERYIAPRRSLINRERPPRWLLPGGRNGGTVRPTKSRVSPAIAKGNKIENVEEDWVRGLPISFPPGASSLSSNKPRQQHHRRRLQRAAANCGANSTNQTSSSPSLGSSTNPRPSNRNASGEKHSRMDNDIEPGKPKWETWTDVDSLQRLVDGRHGEGDGGGEKKTLTTAEMVKRFETGAGVEELRVELEASQASMRRSRHAIEEATDQWRLDRQRALAVAAV